MDRLFSVGYEVGYLYIVHVYNTLQHPNSAHTQWRFDFFPLLHNYITVQPGLPKIYVACSLPSPEGRAANT